MRKGQAAQQQSYPARAVSSVTDYPKLQATSKDCHPSRVFCAGDLLFVLAERDSGSPTPRLND